MQILLNNFSKKPIHLNIKDNSQQISFIKPHTSIKRHLHGKARKNSKNIKLHSLNQSTTSTLFAFSTVYVIPYYIMVLIEITLHNFINIFR